MPCLQCGRGLHNFCLNAGCAICHPSSQEFIDADDRSSVDEDYSRKRRNRGSGKRDESLKDQQSTGRKRAAVKYPLSRDNSCEWQRLRFAGGGNYPIVGCVDGKQQARHHGPDKNTLNNDEGNVHRICHEDHNRWHALNDEGYVWGGIYRPHDPITKATPQDQYDSFRFWSTKKVNRVTD